MKLYQAVLGRLVARTAVHVGSGRARDATDGVCRRDGEGRFIVPGTSIAGALRTCATRLAPRLGAKTCLALLDRPPGRKGTYTVGREPCGCLTCRLFGDLNPGEGGSEKEGGRASRLFVSDAYLVHVPEGRTVRIRDGVGIDRITGAAARAGRVKFNIETLTAGSAFELRLELEACNDDEERLLAATLAEWQAGRAWLGGRVGRGMGAFNLTELRKVSRVLERTGQLLDFLADDKPWESGDLDSRWCEVRVGEARSLVAAAHPGITGVAGTYVAVRFDLALSGSFLTNDPVAAVMSGFDSAPLVDLISRNGIPILPGAGLRGVLRSHAERIARTLSTLAATDREDFLRLCPACNPVESRSGNQEQPIPLTNCDKTVREKWSEMDAAPERDVEHRELCLACRLFGSTLRGSRLVVEDAAARPEDALHTKDKSKVFDFLAIDRVLGGGKDGAKFDLLATWQPTFGIRLHMENTEAWELGWLILLLRDLADGLVKVGFGRAKGFGAATTANFMLDFGYIHPDDLGPLADLLRLGPADTSGLYNVVHWKSSSITPQWLLDTAQQCVERFNDLCRTRDPERMRATVFKHDSYFVADGGLERLYPIAPLQQATKSTTH